MLFNELIMLTDFDVLPLISDVKIDNTVYSIP